MLLDKALVNRNCTGMTLQLDTITVIPFLLTHLSQFGSNGSHVKEHPRAMGGWTCVQQGESRRLKQTATDHVSLTLANEML